MPGNPTPPSGEKAPVPSTDFCIATALLWRTSGVTRPGRQLTRQESHVVRLHCDRILAAAQTFTWTAVTKLFGSEAGHEHFHTLLCKHIPDAIERSKMHSDTWKVRVLVSEDGSIEVVPDAITLCLVDGIPSWPSLPETLHGAQLKCKICRVFVDRQPTLPSALTTHKTNSRRQYEEARSRSKIEHMAPTEGEVLLFNEDREVMEASTCTPYFEKDGVWMTPALSSGGNAGVSRRMAVEAGLCVERIVHIDDLSDGETIWLSNAVRGFIRGRLRLF